MSRRGAVGWLCGLLAVAAVPWPVIAGLEGSKHDLSVRGGGSAKAVTETQICIFCHSPHNAGPGKALWNRYDEGQVYTLYSSSTLQAIPGQPTGSSRHCLGCHDGTIALSRVRNRKVPIHITGGMSSAANLTTDLSDDHPVSFFYDSDLAIQDPELVDPALLPPYILLESGGEMQCISCHNPHDDSIPKFLVVDNAYSDLCTACHDRIGWEGSAHATSTATWSGSGDDPWPHTDWTDVATNACESCHRPHAAGSHESLLNHEAEEENCLPCHDGEVAGLDIDADLRKSHAHEVDSYLGLHDPAEVFDAMPRHVECSDCHDPHAAYSGTAFPPDVSPVLVEVAGVTSGGTATASSSYQYEVCYKCHGDAPNVPAPAIPRIAVESSLRRKLAPTNPSFHPVETPGQNGDVPSLRSPWTESSIIYCTDCHASDSGPGAGGSGPAGPHGSTWEFLLERRYETRDNTRESSQVYALCYKCHDRSSILGDDSFKEHKKHIDGEDAPCSVCHDPHGIGAGQSGSGDHTHLINFDTSIVDPDPDTGLLRFEDQGSRRGQCYLDCHGKKHSPKDY